MNNYYGVRALEIWHGVPETFEYLDLPIYPDPGDGKGERSIDDRILTRNFVAAAQGDMPALLRSLRALTRHQEAVLSDSIVFADEPDNMDLVDICPLLATLNCLHPADQTQTPADTGEGSSVPKSTYKIADWVFEQAYRRNACPEDVMEDVSEWNDAGALQTTDYPGQRIEKLSGQVFHYSRQEGFSRAKGPPKEYRWKKGQSGNPRGRPRKHPPELYISMLRPHFFDEVMDWNDGEGTVKLTRGQVLVRLAVRMAEKRSDHKLFEYLDKQKYKMLRLREKRRVEERFKPGYSYQINEDVTRIDIAIRHLNMAKVEYRKTMSARWKMNPWLVSAAVKRLGKDFLTREEMEEVYCRTRCPHHVDWPEWWPDDLRVKHSQNPNVKIIRNDRKS